jgi:hypothetical protein
MAYDEVALLATTKITDGKIEPEKAWHLAAEEVFKNKKASIEKGCPKGAFLGLCEDGFVKGVQRGAYTKSKLNKRYAIKAVEVLKSHPGSHYPKVLWQDVLNRLGSDVNKKHNSQMEVVLSLWNNGLIN